MNPVLQSIIAAAAAASGAESGWVLGLRGNSLEIVAAAGTDTARLIGSTIDASSGTAGFVVSSGQPMAIAPRPDDTRAQQGVPALLGITPTSVLAVPCTDDDSIVGALELVNRSGGGSFSFDDVELVLLLAGIAGAALVTGGAEVAVRTPSDLGAELERIHRSDPVAYARVATVIEALLARV